MTGLQLTADLTNPALKDENQSRNLRAKFNLITLPDIKTSHNIPDQGIIHWGDRFMMPCLPNYYSSVGGLCCVLFISIASDLCTITER